MVEFVKFDTVRNEITIGDQTVYFYEESRGEITQEALSE